MEDILVGTYQKMVNQMDKNKDLVENTDEEYIRDWDEEVRKIVDMAWEQWNLLKDQKPMAPIYNEEKFGDYLPHCPACKKVLPSISQYGRSNFCYNCGQAVK